MKPLRCWLFKSTAAASLVLLLISVVFWVRSYSVTDRFIWLAAWETAETRIGTQTEIQTGGGGMGFLRFFNPSLEVLPAASRGFGVGGGPPPEHAPPPPTGFVYLKENPRYPLAFKKGIWGFSWGRTTSRPYERLGSQVPQVEGYTIRANAPIWSGVMLSALLPTIWLVLYVRRAWWPRTPTGVCQVCGYDLRATPERCPECGTIAEAAKGAAT